jgi:HD superfamily phosphohydrolase
VPEMPSTLINAMNDFAVRMCNYKPAPFPRTGKVIHDAVWGSIELRKHEVVLLDCSLLQRLRYLHQTGFAFQVFPSARHTRFEHSLGVLRQTDRHLKALSSRFSEFVGENEITELRLAALLHDCSHGMFSHTSEEVYRFLPDMLELIGPGCDYEDYKASELVALLILKSPSFKETMDFFAQNGVALHGTPEELSQLICGQQRRFPNPYKRWLFDVINGPVDADKLDYILRDGLHTGIPLTIDLDRFWLATEIQYLEKGCVEGVEANETRLVINQSGISAVEQILFARFQLTNSVYHHHKIRACDCLFKSWIEDRQKEDKFSRTVDFIQASDTDFLNEVRNLRREEMLKTALVISRGTAKLEPAFWQLVVQSNKKPEESRKLRDIADAIAKEAAVPPDLQNRVWIDLPPLPKVDDLGATIVNLERPPAKSFARLDTLFPVDDWKVMYLNKKWKGYVFSPIKYISEVEKAAKKILPAQIAGLSFES